MAEHLARIIGTEEDRVNCPFYWKIGACRHGDQCSRSHYKPSASQSLILRHMYQNPPVAIAISEGQLVSDSLLKQAVEHFENFYAEVFEELSNYGEIEDMVVCDNIGDHIIGNVYVKYTDEESAACALNRLTGRYYAGKLVQAEYTPVTDFREARCRQFVDGQCKRGGYCNFMHIKHVPRAFLRKLMRKMYKEHPEYLTKPNVHGSRNSRYRRSVDKSRSRYRGDREYGDSYYRDRSDRYHRRRSSSSYNDRRNGGDSTADRERDDRDRDRRVGHGSYRDREGGGPSMHVVRQSSEERRAMIAKWNEEREIAANSSSSNNLDSNNVVANSTPNDETLAENISNHENSYD